MRRTTIVMIGAFAVTLVVSVAMIGILSNSVTKQPLPEISFKKEPQVDVSQVKVIKLVRPGKEWEFAGTLQIYGKAYSENPGRMNFQRCFEDYLKTETKGDTLFISLVTDGQPHGIRNSAEAVDFADASVILYAGSTVNVVNEWPLKTDISALEADSLTLKTRSTVNMDGCRVRYSQIESGNDID